MLHIYNTLSKEKELFKPLLPNKVGLYVCGITVYDYSHIGHARAYLIFDMALRYLQYLGYEVNYIRNITDIDDKIIKRSQENQEEWTALTQRFIQAMHEDFAILNLLPPNQEPRATDYIPEMITFVQTLIDKGYAYSAENGDVYYSVEKFETYGCLSHRKLEDLQAGARIEVNEAKKSPLDFALWKAAKPNEPAWSSPWGLGRPGWHLECSVMSMKNLGATFDIHGGGPDLKFPHHENERAQSEALSGKRFVNFWMHAGYLQIDKEKMSKSLGNFVTIREFLQEYHPEVLRYFNLIAHYRSPVDYCQESIDSAIAGLERLYTALRGLPQAIAPEGTEIERDFQKAMNDDFNTPIAFAVLFELARNINREKERNLAQAATLGALLKRLGNLLGLLTADPDVFLKEVVKTTELNVSEIEALIEKRNQARQARDWALADNVRQTLLSKGVALEDTATGTLWRKA